MVEEIKKEEPKIEPENGKDKPPAPPVTDFKIAEIWIKSGKLYIEAPRTFWMDKIRAVGVLEYCKDIVKQNDIPSDDKPRIIPSSKGGMVNFARNIFGRKR